ncbi:DUF2306 domain-containing protein [Dokdonia sinensis]|uniref:DUF2306 domain-containing protein n=2 Tax=Dokdonia sinensis TaxID=2479847 RepID=A0A3M0G9P1_9FLAO|nr:DUF2306 domain-containing protein [Dokdonia sinensis]
MVVLAVVISLYPIAFALIPGADGLFRSKADALLNSAWYKPIFYVHTSFGGVALLVGSTQFFKKLRQRRLKLHRTLGKIYVISVMISGLSGLVVAGYATGGWIAVSGFTLLGIGWLWTTALAYISVRKVNIKAHERWMIYSYAFCFSAVTLRIYLGLGIASGMTFMDFYPYLAWLCWVPNILFARWRVSALPSTL